MIVKSGVKPKLEAIILSQLSIANLAIMYRLLGFTAIVVYLDDFFICAPTLNECIVTMNTLVALLRCLGFSINWDKVIYLLLFVHQPDRVSGQFIANRLINTFTKSVYVNYQYFNLRHPRDTAFY